MPNVNSDVQVVPIAISKLKLRLNSWQKYSHLLHMTWEASSPSPFTFTLSGLTRLG